MRHCNRWQCENNVEDGSYFLKGFIDWITNFTQLLDIQSTSFLQTHWSHNVVLAVARSRFRRKKAPKCHQTAGRRRQAREHGQTLFYSVVEWTNERTVDTVKVLPNITLFVFACCVTKATRYHTEENITWENLTGLSSLNETPLQQQGNRRQSVSVILFWKRKSCVFCWTAGFKHSISNPYIKVQQISANQNLNLLGGR